MNTGEPQPTTNTLNNLAAVRADVRDTTTVLHTTIDKLIQRGENLDNLNTRAEDLSGSAYLFHGRARQVRRRMRWENYKVTIIIVCVVIAIITIVVLVIVRPWKKK